MISMQIEKYNKPAELRLIQACREGDDTIFSMERPEKGSADNTIRAGLIRALLLGTGDCTPRPAGCGLKVHGSPESWIFRARPCRCRWCCAIAPFPLST